MPVGQGPRKAALDQLERWARERSKIPLLFGVERADLVELTGWKVREIGRQPLFVAGPQYDPGQAGRAQPNRNRELRRQARRALAKHVSWREVGPESLWELQERGLLNRLFQVRWSRQPLAEFSFLVALHPAAGQRYRRYFLLQHRDDTLPLGIAVLVSSDRGWLLEHQIVSGEAPKGCGELLVSELLSCHLRPGEVLSLGITPLYRALVVDTPHQEIPGILSFLPGGVRTALLAAWEPLYGFRRLESYRTKLEPELWEPVYWAHQRGRPAGALMAVLRVFAGGSLGGFLLATFWKHLGRLSLAVGRSGKLAMNRFFLYSLALWIPILWNLDGRLLFGSEVAAKAWALYDLGLLAGFVAHGFCLRARWKGERLVAAVMFGLVAADASLSLLWTVLWHAPWPASIPLGFFLFLLTAAPLAATGFFLLCLARPSHFLRHGGSKGELENL